MMYCSLFLQDFPECEWFLRFCYGDPPPEDSLVHQLRTLTPDTVNDLVLRLNVPYSHVKKFKDKLSKAAMMKIASSEKLDTVLW